MKREADVNGNCVFSDTYFVGKDRQLEVYVPEVLGAKVKVFILPDGGEFIDLNADDVLGSPEKSGFISTVLGNADEDVWNDL